jgi:hypothetical protein
VDEFAEGQLGRMRRKIRKRGQRLSHLEAQRRHRLRIKAKKLRYAAEFLAETFVAQADSGAWWRLSKRYKAPWVTFMISTSRLSWRCNRFAIGPPKPALSRGWSWQAGGRARGELELPHQRLSPISRRPSASGGTGSARRSNHAARAHSIAKDAACAPAARLQCQL